jgi:hypothetical protein
VVFGIVGELAKEEAVSVVVEIPPVLVLLAEIAPEFVLSTSQIILGSPVWQARAVLIENLPRLFPRSVPPEFVRKVTLFQPLSAIRAAIARQLPFVFASGALEDFGQFALAVVGDTDAAVRAAGAAALGTLPETAVNDATPALEIALRDPDPRVQIAAFQGVAKSGFALEAAALSFAEVAILSPWRTKVSLARILPQLVGRIDGETFAQALQALLTDGAANVRRASIETLKELVQKVGVEWRDQVILPIIGEVAQNPDYLLRQSAIEAIAELGLIEDPVARDLIEGIAKDPCPNVRLVLAREVPSGNPLLVELRNDPDPDVAFFASKT